MANVNATDNTATNGGAIYNKGTASFANVNMTANTATSYGGAVYNNLGSLTVVAVGEEDGFFDNLATKGGAIYNLAQTILRSDDGAVLTFDGNKTNSHGGAIFNGGTVAGDDGNIAFNNNAASHGGAIYNNGTASFANVDMSANTATSYGGAVYNNASAELTVYDNATFTSNAASNGGGAIFSSGTVSFADVNMTANTATNGGAVSNSGIASFANVNMTANAATSYGGAIYNYAQGQITMNGNVDLNDNTSGKGDAIFNKGSIVINTQTDGEQDGSDSILDDIFGNEDIDEFFDF